MDKVNVYEEDGYTIIAKVEYNQNLDVWDGQNYQNGGVGKHKGITKLSDGRYVLIYGSQWQNERDYAEVISKTDALQEILRAEKEEFLDEQKYADLKELYERTMHKEV